MLLDGSCAFEGEQKQSQYLRISSIWNFGVRDHRLETSVPPPFIGAHCRCHKPKVTYLLIKMLLMLMTKYSNNINFQFMSVCYTLGTM